jgi:hypothetical protein
MHAVGIGHLAHEDLRIHALAPCTTASEESHQSVNRAVGDTTTIQRNFAGNCLVSMTYRGSEARPGARRE